MRRQQRGVKRLAGQIADVPVEQDVAVGIGDALISFELWQLIGEKPDERGNAAVAKAGLYLLHERRNVDQFDPVGEHAPACPHIVVAYPNVNMTAEMVDALVATRAYEANIGVIEVTRDLAQQTLRILA